MARLSDIKAGQIIYVDGGFTCMSAGSKLVWEDEGRLYVNCREGKHYLEGLQDKDDELIGIHLTVQEL